MTSTTNPVTRPPFDPQSNGFTFHNYWTPNKQVLDQVHSGMEEASKDVFHLLAPIPGIAPIRERVDQTVKRWLDDASTQAFGLCGGMAFAALDYYKAGCQIEDKSQDSSQIPLDLRGYLVKRMVDSLVEGNLARVLAWMWVEHCIPCGIGKRLLLTWTRGECDELGRRLKQNGAWPIALVGESTDPCQNHQVLAFKCDHAAVQCEIYVYDVNYPGVARKLSLNLRGPSLELANDGLPDSWKPLRGLFCEDYTSVEPRSFVHAASPRQPTG